MGERSRGDLSRGDWDRPLAGDFSPTMESMEKPSFPFPLEAARRLWEDLAERVAERMECGGLVEWWLGNRDILTTVMSSYQQGRRSLDLTADHLAVSSPAIFI